jgi:hypothetical protein
MSKADDAQKLADKMALDNRIAAVRENLNQLTEQATGFSGASTEDLISSRIAAQEELLAKLKAERAALD